MGSEGTETRVELASEKGWARRFERSQNTLNVLAAVSELVTTVFAAI